MIIIKESKEPLVDLKKFCPGVIIDLAKWRRKKEKTAHLRRSVAKMINKAKNSLPKGMTFIIGDAWRPQYVQEEIYQSFIKRFTRKNPAWTKSRIIKEVDKYVAPAEGKFASGHMTGGAVDIRLIKNGRRVPMKSKRFTYQENALSVQPKLPKYIQGNRQTMFTALLKAGLSNYPKEYWHWSYGDIQWAQRNKKKIAIYGVIKNILKANSY